MKKYLLFNTKAMEKAGVVTTKELWEKAKADGYTGLTVEAKSEFTKAEGDAPRFHAVFSTATQDRHLEIVFQNFDLSYYVKNPVYLDSHNYDSIERIIGKVEGIGIKEGKLQGDVVFCLDNPVGSLGQKLVEGGFLNTSSIGFIPLEFDNEGNILRAEMLEISAVSVPANPEALFEKKEEKKEVAEFKFSEAKKTPAVYKAALAINKKNKDLILAVAKNLIEMRPSNKAEKQRKIFKALREAFK